jgi:hypothetical protein
MESAAYHPHFFLPLSGFSGPLDCLSRDLVILPTAGGQVIYSVDCEFSRMQLEEIRERLRNLRPEHIRFNEPHFTDQLMRRGGSRDDVTRYLIDPKDLIAYTQETGKYGDTIHCLYFKVSSTRTMKLPVIFDREGLYILTYILRYRPWHARDNHDGI